MPTVVTSPAVTEKHSSPSPVSDITKPSQPPPMPMTSMPMTATAGPADSTTAEQQHASRLEDLETELELDLENMKLDNIDTTVG